MTKRINVEMKTVPSKIRNYFSSIRASFDYLFSLFPFFFFLFLATPPPPTPIERHSSPRIFSRIDVLRKTRWPATGDIIGSTRFTGIAKLRTIIVRTIANYPPINYRRSERPCSSSTGGGNQSNLLLRPLSLSLSLSRFSF